MHPFPSLLNASATAAFALLAGGSAGAALGLATSMAALQGSIGATNDLVDVAADARTKPAKPIPAGLVSRPAAAAVAAAGGGAGLALAALVSRFDPATLVVAVLGYSLGLAYDLRLKRSRWSWLAYAGALPLVPAFAWLGVGAGLPPRFPLLAVMAALGGIALALANGLVDLEGDALTHTLSLAGVLGPMRAWRVIAACQAGLIVVAIVTAVVFSPRPVPLAWLGLAAGGSFAAVGVSLSRAKHPARRQLGWEIQAMAVGLLAAGWFAAQLGLG